MPVLKQRKIWTQQPQVPVGIDWSNPITRGLVCAVSGGLKTPFEAVGNRFVSLTGDSGYVSALFSPSGVSTYVDAIGAASPLYLMLPTSGLSTRSFSVVGRIMSSGVAGAGVGMRGNSGEILLWRNGTAFDMRLGGTDYTAAGTYNLNQFYDYGITGDSSSAKLYVDGAIVINGSVPAAATMANLNIGTDPIGCGEHTIAIEWLGAWSRALSALEIKSLRDKPWQIFAP